MASPVDHELLKRQLNLRNLQRHDASIDAILRTTSYAAVYHHKGTQWEKSNVEGPMFLFSTTALSYGLFILNRNGPEYVREWIGPDSDVRLDGEFILFETHSDAERATGIWVHDEKERGEVYRHMAELRARQ